jgi:hypothetical protein
MVSFRLVVTVQDAMQRIDCLLLYLLIWVWYRSPRPILLIVPRSNNTLTLYRASCASPQIKVSFVVVLSGDPILSLFSISMVLITVP